VHVNSAWFGWNAAGHLGMTAAFGGGTFDSSSVVGS